MGKIVANPKDVGVALQPHLEPGEQLRCAAYGIAQSNLLSCLVFFLLLIPATLINLLLFGARPGLATLTFFALWLGLLALVAPLLRKDYLVGLTDRRLLLVRVKTPLFTIDMHAVQAVVAYPLDALPSAQTKIGPLRVIIKLQDQRQTIRLQFGGRGLNENRDQAIEIARALKSD